MVSVIQATSDHLDQVAPLFDAYRQFYEQSPDLNGARHFLQQHFEGNTSVILLATGDDREGVGFIQLYPSFSSVRMRPVWILNDLFVVPSRRRQGIGRLLMEHASAFALQTGAAYVVLETATDNHQAKALYKDLGYQTDAAYEHFTLML